MAQKAIDKRDEQLKKQEAEKPAETKAETKAEAPEEADAPLTDAEIAELRPKIAGYLKGNEEGKEKLKSFLDSHGAERVTKLTRKSAKELMKLIEGVA